QTAFTASPGSFQLPVGGEQPVEVTYDPTDVGVESAVLTVTSDDPDESEVTISLLGESLEPPVIAVSVDSIAVTVPVGETAVESFTIDNSGGSNLTWAVEAGFNADAPLVLTVAPPAGAKNEPAPSRAGGSAVVNILWYGNHGLGDIPLWSTIISDIADRGGVVTQTFGPITPTLLSDAAVLWFGNDETALTQAEMDAIEVWVNDGGSLLFEADGDAAVSNHSILLQQLGAGLNYSLPDGFAGVTNVIYPHTTTANVNQLFLLSPGARVHATSAPGGLLFDDLLGQPMGAYSEVGDGRIVAMSDHLFHDVAITQQDNRLFANQVFTWLTLGSFNWLAITPQSGTLDPGNSVEVGLELDGSILPGGEYDFNLEVMSNDPATPVVTIPLHVVVDSTVTVTGVNDQTPSVYALHPNYPNPFNPTTTVRYDLPAAQDVKIAIYNVRGELVRVLVDRYQAAGRHEAVWDGRNSRGESVASGVYLYRIVAGDYVDTRKMTLLK
ncbi:MAG: FlgD immunoglobulin-like domain containing protein, partial [Candidatus Latescibacterota bacterium]